MVSLNFYKIRTLIDIRPKDQGGNEESQIRYDQIIQTVSQRSEIEYIHPNVLMIEEVNPTDLYTEGNQKVKIYVFIFALNRHNSGWTASALKTELGNMRLQKKLTDLNEKAIPWVGGVKNNISCEVALFDLRAKKR